MKSGDSVMIPNLDSRTKREKNTIARTVPLLQLDATLNRSLYLESLEKVGDFDAPAS
jgi:hypothetical protein